MATRQHIKTLAGLAQKDFFGIHDITSKDIAAAYANVIKLAPKQRDRKYDALMGSRVRLTNDVREETADFGAVRYDDDNAVQMHGQYEEGNTEKLYDTIKVKQMFVLDSEGTSSQERCSEEIIVTHPEQIKPELGNPPYKISEVQAIKELDEVLRLFWSENDRAKSMLRYSRKPPLTFYFDGVERTTEQPKDTPHELCVPLVTRVVSNKKTSQAPGDGPGPEPEPESAPEIRRPQQELDALAGTEGLRAPLHELDAMSEEYMERELELQKSDRFDRRVDAQFDVAPEPAKKMKALDYLKQVRAGKIEPTAKELKRHLETTDHPYSLKPEIKLDSKGYNNYKYQVPDWYSVRRTDALNYIRKSIVYNNYDILAINKPYGIASHENIRGRGVFDMNDLVTEVAKSMRIERVHLAHRLDKTTTGILLFATSDKTARVLSDLFKKGEIKKTYWCITKGIPNPPKGVLDIPIGEFLVAGKLRSVPVPEGLQEDKQLAKRYREARRAVTEFEVLDRTKHMALVQCTPQTGVKHQIRCHLGFGLKTPILGDHKYSYLNKLAPQQLPQQVLDAFRVRQSKVRSLPVHLHAKSIAIPGVKANGEMLFIEAELPQHFHDNMKTLQLSGKQKKR